MCVPKLSVLVGCLGCTIPQPAVFTNKTNTSFTIWHTVKIIYVHWSH